MSKVRPENFIHISGWMRTDLGLKGNELLLYAIIYGFTQTEDQKYTGSQQYLAEWLGVSRQWVITCLKSLVERGLITKEEVTVNGVRFCNYSANFTGCKESLQGVCQESLHHIKDKQIIEEERNSKERNFDRWWSAYPRKVNKEGAKKIFLKLDVDIEVLMSALESQKNSEQWTKDDGQFIPHPTTYLNQHRWEGVEPAKPTTNLMLRGIRK